jgi:arginine/lysine/ornithine decarboxylase
LVEGVPYDLQSQPMTTPVISYEASERLEKELIPLQQAEGRIAAKMVIPYPPGVPLLLDGERITDDHLDHMKALLDAGARFHGLNGDHSLWVYKMNKTVM